MFQLTHYPHHITGQPNSTMIQPPLWKRGGTLVIHGTSPSLAEDQGLLGTIGVFVRGEVETFSLRNARHAAPIRRAQK